ncbi:hypothetical protein KC354_g138 [Hortaea werneckii]|nr:hypothetical protein KC354_g138 [Hortaea werneckii]
MPNALLPFTSGPSCFSRKFVGLFLSSHSCTQATASSLDMTSHRPSDAMIRKSGRAPVRTFVSVTSGSAVRAPEEVMRTFGDLIRPLPPSIAKRTGYGDAMDSTGIWVD